MSEAEIEELHKLLAETAGESLEDEMDDEDEADDEDEEKEEEGFEDEDDSNFEDDDE